MEEKQVEKFGEFGVFEGMDGCGKGRTLEIVKERLQKELPDRRFFFTFEPGGTEVGNEIRVILQKIREHDMSVVTDILLYIASRIEHLYKVIIPALTAGIDVISDRYEASTYAYQIYGRGHEEYLPLLHELNKLVKIRKPDFYILLDQDPEISRERANHGRADAKSRFDIKPIEFYVRVRNAYFEFMKTQNCRTVYVGLKTPEQVADEVMTHLRELLGD